MTTISSSTLISGGAVQQAQAADASQQKQVDQKAQDSQSSYGPPYMMDISQAGLALMHQDENGAGLTDEQRQTIQTIFDKYKDTPLTEETLQQISDDLHAAGVAPDQLANTEPPATASAEDGPADDTQKSDAAPADAPPAKQACDKSGGPPPGGEAKPKGGGAPGGGGGAADDTSDAVETAKNKVRPQVGSVGADTVVDDQGNINYRMLNKMIAEQEQQSHRFDPVTDNS